jgi:hypothetical protein
MKATIEAVLNDGDVEFAADFSAPWIFVGGPLSVEGVDKGRVYLALQREDAVQPPIGRLYQKNGEWRGELGLAAKGFDLLLQAYFSPIFFQLSLTLDVEADPLGGAEYDVGMMDIAVTRYEPAGPEQ